MYEGGGSTCLLEADHPRQTALQFHPARCTCHRRWPTFRRVQADDQGAAAALLFSPMRTGWFWSLLDSRRPPTAEDITVRPLGARLRLGLHARTPQAIQCSSRILGSRCRRSGDCTRDGGWNTPATERLGTDDVLAWLERRSARRAAEIRTVPPRRRGPHLGVRPRRLQRKTVTRSGRSSSRTTANRIRSTPCSTVRIYYDSAPAQLQLPKRMRRDLVAHCDLATGTVPTGASPTRERTPRTRARPML